MISQITVGGVPAKYLTLTFKRQIGAEDIGYHVEASANFASWMEVAVLAASIFNGDGTVTETWRAPQPAAVDPKSFLRLRVTAQ